jgi:hypothetical protein
MTKREIKRDAWVSLIFLNLRQETKREREKERRERSIDAWVLRIFRDLRTSAISEPPGIPKT